MTESSNLQVLIKEYAIGKISPHSLPEVAEMLVSQGFESPSLLDLLIEETPYSGDLKILFERALSELGLEVPDRNSAAVYLSLPFARKIVSGELSAHEGAMQIWEEVLWYLGHNIPEELVLFEANASLIEDCLTDEEMCGSKHTKLITCCQQEIIAAARKLI